MGREGRDVLLVGAAFALGVFLTYLGVGFGVLKFLAALPFLDMASRWIYGVTAALCLVLAAGSLYDWWQARRGAADEMRLKLPGRLRRWINRTIREGSGARVFVLVYFGTTSQQLSMLIHRHTTKVKLATAGLFLLLAGWMIVTLL